MLGWSFWVSVCLYRVPLFFGLPLLMICFAVFFGWVLDMVCRYLFFVVSLAAIAFGWGCSIFFALLLGYCGLFWLFLF
jgi:hypothetical protein